MRTGRMLAAKGDFAPTDAFEASNRATATSSGGIGCLKNCGHNDAISFARPRRHRASTSPAVKISPPRSGRHIPLPRPNAGSREDRSYHRRACSDLFGSLAAKSECFQAMAADRANMFGIGVDQRHRHSAVLENRAEQRPLPPAPTIVTISFRAMVSALI